MTFTSPPPEPSPEPSVAGAHQIASDAEFWALYEEVSTLGRGSFGEVKLVRLRSTGVLVAVKTVAKSSAPAHELYGNVTPQNEPQLLMAYQRRSDQRKFDSAPARIGGRRKQRANMTPQSFVTAVHAMEPSMPIALLALNAFELRELDPRVDQALKINVNKRLTWEAGGGGAAVAAASPSSADALADAWVWPFLWQGNPSLFTAMFKVVEDRLNAAQDTDFGVQLVLLIEDNVKFYSSYLPVLYQELLKQNQALQSETMGSREKLLRMHSRPKVMLCTNYEEAADIFRRYSPNVMGVITDAGFPRNGEHDLTAGLKLAAEALEHAPELPVLVQSGDSKLATKVEALGAKFVSKESNVLLASLRDFMTQELKLGPLEFLDGVTGAKLGEVSTVTELVETWAPHVTPQISHPTSPRR